MMESYIAAIIALSALLLLTLIAFLTALYQKKKWRREYGAMLDTADNFAKLVDDWKDREASAQRKAETYMAQLTSAGKTIDLTNNELATLREAYDKSIREIKERWEAWHGAMEKIEFLENRNNELTKEIRSYL